MMKFCNYQRSKLLTLNSIFRAYSSLDLELKEINRDLFPPIKPKYPPGLWSSNLDENSAWAINEYSQKLLSLPSAKEKLENLAGDEAKILWILKATTNRVKNLEFYKYVTKTNIIKGLPNCYEKLDISNHLNFEKIYINTFSEEFKYFERKLAAESKTKESRTRHYAIGNLLRQVLFRSTYISKNCIFDENARIESFWRVSGFIDKKLAKGTWDVAKLKGDADAGFLQFQFQHIANYQIRSQHPLPEFLTPNDSECNNKFSLTPESAPHIIGLEFIEDRPISVSGHWIGSKYPFSIGCVHLMEDGSKISNLKSVNEDIIDEAELQFATATCFASCRAQAANHGFNDFLDVTYPMTTSCLLVNKNRLRLFAYQLNSLQVWNEANPRNNVLWASPSVRLHNDYSLTKDALQLVAKFISLRPEDRGVDYWPYVSPSEADATQLRINRKGEEAIDQPPVERFKYPKYSVYYRTFI